MAPPAASLGTNPMHAQLISARAKGQLASATAEESSQQSASKRPKRSVSDLGRFQRSRTNLGASQASGGPGTLVAFSDVASSDVAFSASTAFGDGGSVKQELPELMAAEGDAVAQAARDGKAGLKARGEEQLTADIPEASVTLSSSEEVDNDLSLKTGLELQTSYASFAWLRRLPAVLRCQTRCSGPAREAVLDVCRDCLPSLMGDPEKALKWMEQIVPCISWHEVDSVALPGQSTEASVANSSATVDDVSQRRVDEWVEAYRSVGALLRQGLISSYAIVGERYTVTVFGEGAGSWGSWQDPSTSSSAKGVTRVPTRDEPIAVVCPSFSEFRTMLQENHVPFDVAGHLVVPDVSSSTQLVLADNDLGKATAFISLRELRRNGEKVVTPEEGHRVAMPSSSLLFEGSWRVHALLDILLQHVLGSPLVAGAVPPARLPKLVAPGPFPQASARFAQVVSTRTNAAPPLDSAAGTRGLPRHTAEIRGCFFPSQVRRFLELLRVLIPSFQCSLTSHVNDAGVNAFTRLGMKRIEEVRCEKLVGLPSLNWKWDFKLCD